MTHSIRAGRVRRQSGRPAVLGVVAAAALAGLLFCPVFGAGLTPSVAVPVGTVAATTYGCYEAARRWPRVERWRAGLSLLVGLLAIVETTLRETVRSGLPTAASIRALYRGVRESWLVTLQTTWPAPPEPQLTVFVPLLALAAAVLGVQVLSGSGGRLTSLLPGLAVAGLAQAYQPLSGSAALLVGLGFAAIAAAMVASWRRLSTRSTIWAAALVGAAILGALTGGVPDPAGRQPYSLQHAAPPPAAPVVVANPLDEIAYRLEHPRQVVFTDTAANADLWPIAVLDRFDGTNWTSGAQYRHLGSRLEPRRAAGPSSVSSGSVTLADLSGPWLPSQRGLESVSGIRPLVDEATGTLLSGSVRPGMRYTLRWSSPLVDGARLAGATLDTDSVTTASPGLAPPDDITLLARAATGGRVPSFRAALLLERYLRRHYHVATGPRLPAGHGWPQIQQFLGPANRRGGTSEQFAAAYVALARAAGIRARLVVGFRQPSRPQPGGSYVVHNGDVFAWPEVEVKAVGWVALDPTGSARSSSPGDDRAGLTNATEQAREELPPPQNVDVPAPPAPAGRPLPPPGRPWSLGFLRVMLATVLAGVLSWLLGVPVAKSARRALRRRRTGAGAVLAAWFEARDQLRDHGVAIEPGMTVHDVAIAAGDVVDRPGSRAIARLGVLVDIVLWSGTAANTRFADDAWEACRTVRRSLAERRLAARLVSAWALRGLRSPK